MLIRKPRRSLAEQLFLFMFIFLCNIAVAVPSFTADKTSGCNPLRVQFTSNSTGAVSWYWDLGNGNTSTLENPANLYTSQGNYTITLITHDAGGNADTARYTNYISVVGKPNADFTVNANTACPGNNLFSFTNLSTGGAVSFLWDFGDGTTSIAQNPTHSYLYDGSFTVTMIATNAFGCQDLIIKNHYITIYPKPDVTIHVSDTSNCDALTNFHFSNNAQNAVSWLWYFGDFSSSTLQNPVHRYQGPGHYQVYVTVQNTFGCTNTTEIPTNIIVGVKNWVDFSTNVDSGCTPLTVDFTNPPMYIQSCLWDFGDGSTSNSFSASHTYLNGGNYTVKMMLNTQDGCSDTLVKNNLIKVGTTPTVNFQHSTSQGCVPLTVQFTNTSLNFVSCTWYFGDGTSSTAINPTHIYTNDGIFTVTLQTTGPEGCTNNLSKQNIITAATPHAIYTATPRIGCPPLQSTFTSFAQNGSLSYLWNFGDGATSTIQNPTHIYTTSGNFNVSLIVTDSIGCRDTITKSNFIQTINPAANYIPPPLTSGCRPLTAQFTDATVGSVSWHWDFGDGFTSNIQNPTHVYADTGTFTVSLITQSAGGGCSQTISNFSTFEVNGGYAGFTHSASICPPYIANFQDTSSNAVSWFWDFGDGTTSNLQNPSHAYVRPGYHSVSLTVTTATGCTYTTAQSNSVYFAPFGANFYGIPMDTIFPVPVQFYSNSVGATSWLWNFGDGTTSNLENPIHTYQNPGLYYVTLTISNGVCTLFYDPPPFDFGENTQTPIDVGHGPYVEIQKGCAPLDVLFTNRIPGTSSWTWDFGDGTTSNDQYPFHVYSSPGIYSVTLTATDTFGIAQVLQLDSIVRVSGPQAGFIINQTASCTNTQIAITDTSVNAIRWKWNMGDGTVDSVQNPMHSYIANIPNYIITQTVTDTMGCSSSISTSIFADFVSPLLASENEVCGFTPVHFFTSLQNYSSYRWDFGDGQMSTQINPSHTYTQEGTYTVSLTVIDVTGCSQTFFVNPSISVKIPISDFTTTDNRQGCNEADINFTNRSRNADSYLWDFGDGNSSTLVNPFHKYTQVGVYAVSVTVYRGSCISKVTYPQYIRVDTAHADFTYSTNQICLPLLATFHDLSINPVSWKWHFGDGDSSFVENPQHIYNVRPGFHPILIMSDIHGCTDTVLSPNFPVMVADFSTSADSGCFPFTVHFTNLSSLIVDDWHWDFGDGTSSTDPNPVHTYAQPGEYDITLIVKSIWANCNDTLFIPAKIKVRQPQASFSSTELKACAPSLVNFTNASVDADNNLWDFGDGATSTNVNPSHIYNTPGLYSVKLVTSSTLGCSDSLTRPQYIQVLGPITRFTASGYLGCAPYDVSFTDQSINAFVYNWNFGDGYSEFQNNPVHTFRDTGSFTVSLVTQDTSGCNSYYELPQPIVVHPTPDASFTISGIRGCQPFNTSFTNTSTGNQYSLWNFGDGDTSVAINPVHDYDTPGSFDVKLIAYNQYGCSDTALSSQPLEVLTTPVPSFSINDVVGCAPFHAVFVNNSTNLDGPAYLWDFGNGFYSTDANPAYDYTQPGTYSIGVKITNANGCSDSISYPAMISVSDSLPPGETKILSVSVLSNTSVKIIWENNPAIDLDAYEIYRLDAQMNVFRLIYTQSNYQNTNFSLTSEYTDNGLNTLQNTYTYKVKAVDVCANSIPLDQVIAHTTINVSSYESGDNIHVRWTPYGGCAVSSYQLYRALPGETFSFIASLPPDSLSYLDTTIVCPVAYSYKVMATDLCGNTYTSYSDTSVTIPDNILAEQVVDVIRSTVVENKTVLTEWNQPLVHPDKVAHFDIYRSTDNVNFYYIESIPSVQTDYMDYNVDVQNDHYYYKILVINTCDVGEDLSGNTSTIILKGEIDELRQVHLGWSPYEGWENGVEYYIIEKQDENGNWQLLRQVDGNTFKFDYQEY